MSKKVTNSNTVSLMDGLYTYEIPLSVPNDEKDIINFDVYNKQNQIWTRPDIPDVRRLTEKKRIEIIDLHRKRWLEGVWILIGGELVYLTGMHYDFLVFNKFDFGYPNYLDQQRLDFYFRDLVRKDADCFGKCILKCRRSGMSSEEISEGIYTLLEDENSHVGLQSNTDKKVKETLMLPFIETYLARPIWMREKIYTPASKKPRNGIELTCNVLKDEDSDENNTYLGGTARAYPTVASAMDGTKKRFIVQDEAFKWTTASTMETLDINKKCVVEYGIKGKIDVLSTMGDSDNQLNAVKEGCKMYMESNPLVRDANNRTTSGLYKWFVSAIHSADIPDKVRDPVYTRFGKVNKDACEAYVWAQANKYAKDSKQYVFELRRMPLKEEHGLMSANDKTYFSVMRFDERLNHLYALPIDQKPYVKGDLVEDKQGKVWFEQNDEGAWLVAVMPYFDTEKNIDTRNRFRRSEGTYYPPINPEGCIGYDPIRYKTDNTISKKLSKASIVVYQKFDYFGSGNANKYCALYLQRPSDPKIAHKECVKACKFWGYPVMAERQVESTEEVFEEENMSNFLLKSETDKKWGMWTTPKTTENGLQMLVTRFDIPKSPNDIDQLEQYPFEEGLEDKKNFDLSNTEESHITMSEVMLEYGLKQIQETNLTDNSTRTMMQIMMEINPPRNK